MRTTLDLNDALMKSAKVLAAREHTTLTRIIEQGLALRIRAAAERGGLQERPPLPVYAGRGGLSATVKDALTNRALVDAADGEGHEP